MDQGARIYVAGHTGLAGSAIVCEPQRASYSKLVLRYCTESELIERFSSA